MDRDSKDRGLIMGRNWVLALAMTAVAMGLLAGCSLPEKKAYVPEPRPVKSAIDLPTEAQWEYACRAGTTSYYSDGQSTSAADTNILNEIAWWSGNSGGTTHTVGEKKPNLWGLYDMHGNLFELCLDWFDAVVGGNDPTGSSSGPGRARRGGRWGSSASDCSSVLRYDVDPKGTYNNVGFRLAIVLP